MLRQQGEQTIIDARMAIAMRIGSVTERERVDLYCSSSGSFYALSAEWSCRCFSSIKELTVIPLNSRKIRHSVQGRPRQFEEGENGGGREWRIEHNNTQNWIHRRLMYELFLRRKSSGVIDTVLCLFEYFYRHHPRTPLFFSSEFHHQP